MHFLLNLIMIYNFIIVTICSQPPNDCLILREVFSDSISLFTSCAIQNSRPITICEKCVQFYINILSSYENMTKAIYNGTACIDYYVGLDRLQVVNALKISCSSLWDKAKCYECFKAYNGTLTAELSTKTLGFNKYYNSFQNCLHSTCDTNLNVCIVCAQKYTMLNEYYKSISNENEYISVCMDIVDRMNSTWSYWNNTCSLYRNHSEYIFTTSAIGMLLLTLLLYGIARFCTKKRIPTILQQRRFAESLTTAD